MVKFARRAHEIHYRFLDQVEQILPVLREENNGIHDLRDDFADTGMHLTEKAARERSKILVKNL